METLFIPWLDVNQKVEYRSIATGEAKQYIIREIRVSPMTGTMSVTMARFFPLYALRVVCDEVICDEAICGG